MLRGVNSRARSWLSSSECKRVLGFWRQGVPPPPELIDKVMVMTEGMRRAIERIKSEFELVEGGAFRFLVIVNPRGAGKTTLLRYLEKELGDRAHYLYTEVTPTSAEMIFREIVRLLGRERLEEIVRKRYDSPLSLYNEVSSLKGAHTGVAIALAGLHEGSDDCWSWLSVGSPSLKKLKCGLRMVRNLRESEALNALRTLLSVIEEPVVVAFDEVQLALSGLSEREKEGMIRSLVDMINRGMEGLMVLFGATEDAYEEVFEGDYSKQTGLSGRIAASTIRLGPPTLEERRKFFEKALRVFECAYSMSLSKEEVERIRERVSSSISPEAMPRDILIGTILELEKIELGEERKILEEACKVGREELSRLSGSELGKRFQENLSVMFSLLDWVEDVQTEVDAEEEIRYLLEKARIPAAKVEKSVDIGFKYKGEYFWVEAAHSEREKPLPLKKVVAVCSKSLKGGYGLFLTHNIMGFTCRRGAWKIFSRLPSLRRKVAAVRLGDEVFQALMGLHLLPEEEKKEAAAAIFEFSGLREVLEDLLGGRHFLSQYFGG